MRVILIFDIGKTNKKALLFNEQYEVVWKDAVILPETTDEDGFPCDDLPAIALWIREQLLRIAKLKEFVIAAINCTAYGASLVCLDEKKQHIFPLYNYLKPYSPELLEKFSAKYPDWPAATASPALGNLNAGLQMYRLKDEQPEKFKRIRYVFHLPDYISFLISGSMHAEMTSIGCHTAMWDFKKKQYHRWLLEEGLLSLLPPLKKATEAIQGTSKSGNTIIGTGLHDSSAALVPYLKQIKQPFLLLSTGTWSISLNPFNNHPLTIEELEQDCLCYLSPEGTPVKASRLFAGAFYDQQVQRIAEYFHMAPAYFASLRFNASLVKRQQYKFDRVYTPGTFHQRDLSEFATHDEAYHHFIHDLVEQQAVSTGYVLLGTRPRKIFVDGGFSKNEVFMHFFAKAMQEYEVSAATVGEASALGAALIIHEHWNPNPIPEELIQLKKMM